MPVQDESPGENFEDHLRSSGSNGLASVMECSVLTSAVKSDVKINSEASKSAFVVGQLEQSQL